MEFKKVIAVSDFVKKRHLDHLEYTHYKGSWNDLENRTLERFQGGFFRPGYRDGVVLVQMDDSESKLFFSYDGFEMFEGMKLSAEYKPRQTGEEPRLCVRILEPKIQCKFVDIVLYRWDVLAEDNDRSQDSEWEIISINGKQKDVIEPMRPLTMARNFLHLQGGTKGEFTAKDFAESIIYWSKKIGE